MEKKTKKPKYVVDKNGLITKVADNSKNTPYTKNIFLQDGYDFGDATATAVLTSGDVALNIFKGASRTAEGIVDLTQYGVAQIADFFDNDTYADKVRLNAKKDVINDYTSKAQNLLNKGSILGDTGKAVAEGVGQVGSLILTGNVGGALGLGTKGVSALTTGLMGASSVGSGISEAYQNNATDKQAWAYGAMKGTVDTVSELIFGGFGKDVKALGFGKGLTSIDDVVAKKLSSLVTKHLSSETAQKLLGNTVEYAIKSGAEGLEEVLAGIGTAYAKKFSYMPKENIKKLIKDENLLEQFVVGTLTSAIVQGGDMYRSTKSKKDFITGYTANEQKVIDSEVNRIIEEHKANGEKVNKSQIYDEVEYNLKKGYIGTDTIESILGENAYNEYKKASDTEREETQRLQNEISSLEDKMNSSEKVSSKDRQKLSSLRDELNSLTNNSKLQELKEKLDSLVKDKIKGTSLAESYNEIARQSETFTADLSQYTKKEQRIVQKAIDSGILNNTNRSHELVDLIAKLSAHLDTDFDFVNNKKLKESGFAIEGKTVNGFVTKDGIVINTQSPKYLNSVVGHEVAHILKASNLFDSLQTTLFNYAKSKGEYDTRLEGIKKAYEGMQNVNIEEELTADLVGDYLFTDRDFVNHLLNTDRNVFQKIYDELKYLCKIATTGSKEEKELLKAKKIFDEVYSKGETKAVEGVKYSISQNLNSDLDAVLNGTFDASKNEVYIGETSNFMVDIIGADSLSVYMPASKAYSAMVTEEEYNKKPYYSKQDHYHGIGKKDLIEILEKSETPIVAFAAAPDEKGNSRRNRIVLVTDKKIKDLSTGTQGYAVVIEEVDSNAISKGKRVKANKTITVYSRALLDEDIQLAIADGRLLDITTKGEPLFAGVRGSNPQAAIQKDALKKNIANFWANVKWKGENTSSSSPNIKMTAVQVAFQKAGLLDQDGQLQYMQDDENKLPNSSNRKNSLSSPTDTLPGGNFKITSEDVTLKTPETQAKTESPLDDIPIRKEPTLQELIEEKEDLERRAEEEAEKARESGDMKSYIELSQRYDEVRRLIAKKETSRINIDERKLNKVANYLLRITKSSIAKDDVKPLLEELYQEIANSSNTNTSAINEKIRSVARRIAESIDPPKRIVQGIKDVLDDIKGTQIRLSESQKSELKHVFDKGWSRTIRKSAKVTKDSHKDLETRWQEWSHQYPNLFSSDVNEADMGVKLVEITEKLRENLFEYEDVDIDYIAEWLSEEILSQYDNLVPSQADLFPDAEELIEEDISITGQNRQKLEKLRKELFNDMSMREDTEAMYDSQIAELEKRLTDGDINLHREIANLKAMKEDALSKYDERINNISSQIERMHSKSFKRVVQRKVKQQDYFDLFKNIAGNTRHWKDKKWGLFYSINTLRRNLRDIVRGADDKPDFATADLLYEELQGKYNKNEALFNQEANSLKKPFAELELTNAEREYAQMLGELRHNPETTLEKEDVMAYFNNHSDSIDPAKVDKAIEMARKLYDELFVRVNEVLREHGFKEIPYRKGYFPHFEDTKQGILGKIFNWKTVDTDIPTDIAGLTEQFNPERSYQSYNKERKTDKTDYDLYKGLDSYIDGALDWIYHIEDLQKRRAFENYIRYTHSDQGIKEQIKAIMEDDTLDSDEVQKQIDAVYAEAENPLNNFVTDLRRGTNTLAGKKSSFDRGMEGATNRKIYSVMTNLNNRNTANMVGGSISAAFTNFIPITQSWIQVSPLRTLEGMAETLRATFHDDGVVEKSSFLTNRLNKNEKLSKGFWDKANTGVGWLMEAVDSFSSQTIWRSKFNTNIAKGMSESEAIANADQFCENVMAGRSRGNMPTAFDAKNPIAKFFTNFQLEVANQYGYMFKDAPQEMAENKAKLSAGYAKAFIGAYLYNSLAKVIMGNTPALDPIRAILELLQDLGVFGDDDEDETTEKLISLGMLGEGGKEDIPTTIKNFSKNVFQELPFVGGLAGGGRVPIAGMLPFDGSVEDNFDAVVNVFEGKKGSVKKIGEEWLNSLAYFALPFGGGQIKKSLQGLSMFLPGKPVSGNYTAQGNLRYPVEKTAGNILQAGIFGRYANKNAREYIETGKSPLNDKQLEEFLDSQMPISDYWKYREGLKGKTKAEEKADYINSLDVPIATKNLLINNQLDRKTPFDMTDYDKFGSFDEANFAQNNPDKYALISNVFGYDTFQKYQNVLKQIKGDWAQDRKFRFINEQKISAIKKKILFKYEYKGWHECDYEIVKYIDSLKISKAEKEKIAEALGLRAKER